MAFPDRVTTSEAAEMLGVSAADATALLKGMRVPFARAGRRGAFLWDHSAILELVRVSTEVMPSYERTTEWSDPLTQTAK